LFEEWENLLELLHIELSEGRDQVIWLLASSKKILSEILIQIDDVWWSGRPSNDVNLEMQYSIEG